VNGRQSFFLDGVAPAREEELLSTVVTFVTPGYLDALEAAPLRGRDLTWADDANAPPVALVNDLWVRRFSPELDPIGRRVTLDGVEAEIVGIVPHLVAADVEEQRQDALYMAYLQAPRVMNVRIMARTIGDPIAATPAIRVAVAALDRDRPLFEIGTLHEAIYAEKGVLSAFGALFFLFGLGALLMTVVGLYGVVSFAVSRRMREIGIRMAVGARARNLVPLVIGEGSGPLAIGGAVGLVLAAALSHALAASIGDPMRPPGWSLYPFVAVVIGGTTLAALLVPIRKALGVQPASALRAE
jgi:hypothetical protein